MLTKSITYQKPSLSPPPAHASAVTMEEDVLRYSPLVKTMALRLQARLPDEVSADDLLMAGIIGLMDAVNKYDASRGIPFVVYAKTRIRGAMLDEIRAMDWVPRGVRQKGRHLEKVVRMLEGRLGRYPVDEEIAAELGVTLDEYHNLLCDVKTISFVPEEELMGTTENGESDIQGEHLETPFQLTYRQEIQDYLAAAIATLPEREQRLLGLYYQEDLTMREIGAVLGCTESRICQLHTKIMLKLKSKLAQKLSREDLPAHLAADLKSRVGKNGKRRSAAVAPGF
jgi:RNA polymerase sigma factor for flagellar operon FliA